MVGEEKRGEDERERRCRKLLAQLRDLCPDLVSGPPLGPGEIAPATSLGGDTVQALLPVAVGAPAAPRVVWHAAGSEVLVHLDACRVVMREGLVLVGLVLETEQTGRQEVVVPFAVGSAERPGGMLALAERKPRGPAVLVDRWGEAIIATAWQALLDIADAAARTAGLDTAGRPLRPGALLAEDDGLRVVPQAEHAPLEATRRERPG